VPGLRLYPERFTFAGERMVSTMTDGTRERPAPGKGEPLTLEVDDLNAQGEGVGRVNGLVVFVPGALPGDVVRVRLGSRRAPRAGGRGPAGTHPRSHAVAELLSVERPSRDRVKAPCAVAEDCGGCQLLALDYRAQLRWKTRVVSEALRRVGHLGGVPVRPCLGARNPLGYRNKAQFPVIAGYGPAHLRAGLFRRGTHDVVPVESCALQRPVNNAVLEAAVRLASNLGVRPYDEDTREGLLRHILARVSSDGREAMAVFVTAQAAFPAGRRLAARLMEAVPAVKTVVQNVNTRRTNVILGSRNIVLAGPGHITDHVGGLRFRVSVSSFFQVNPEQAEALYAVVAEMVGGARRVADVYSGVGTITLYLATRVSGIDEVVGIESNPDAVHDAVANARDNHVDNVSFIHGDAARVLRDLATAGAGFDAVVLDPPRKGCEEEVLRALAKLRPARVIYVSCNPATLARDLAWLAGAGFRVGEVRPVDMFPETTHVEAVAMVERA